MKKNLVPLILIVALISIISCSKNIAEIALEKNEFKSVNEVPDSLFKGSEFYGIWKIDSVKTLSGHYYYGNGTVLLAFTNDGKIIIENQNHVELNHIETFAPDWKISPWFFISGAQKYEMKTLQASNEISLQEGFPYTATYSFTEKKENWTGHFSNQRFWLYQWSAGNAQVHIWGKKAN